MSITNLMLRKPTPVILVDEMTPLKTMIDHTNGAAPQGVVSKTGRHTHDRLPTVGLVVGCASDTRGAIHPTNQRTGDTRSVDTAMTISYGDTLPTEADLRLCGDLSTKRVLELGVFANNSISFAQRGAKAIVVESDPARISEVRRRADLAEVRVECHEGGPADLGFATSASIDLVVSVGSYSGVDDISRVFRQVHRVLRPDATFVLSMPHPVARMFQPDGSVQGRYGHSGSQDSTVSGLFGALQRANFMVDVLLEPWPSSGRGTAPGAIIMRSRKLGL